ncbi:MAG: DUF411 domain-containing protein [Gammaproteobacteria bacterium]|nr:DUF411 domain-containing protein [Gammaproteobacteria bacterium]
MLPRFLTPLLLLVLAVIATPGCSDLQSAEALPPITVYRHPSCGCCSLWMRHLKANGFEVQAEKVLDMEHGFDRFNIPRQLEACHTAVVDGYLIEGHVPAADVMRLLEERPDVRGLAVPGMPIGSPGMEGPNPEAYQVLSFDKHGVVREFSYHEPRGTRP